MVNQLLIALGVAALLQSSVLVAKNSTQALTQEQGVTALRKRAEAGDPKAEVQLGTAYASGDGVTRVHVNHRGTDILAIVFETLLERFYRLAHRSRPQEDLSSRTRS